VVTLITEMIRTCPKCGDYYADELLAFCLADGTPLVNVNPHSQNWSEGTRVIEEKENALRKQERRLKRRRLMLRAMTMLMAAIIVLVVVVNGMIYLKPAQEEPDQDEPLTAATAPGGPSVSVVQGKPLPTPKPTAGPRPTASPIATETTRPTPAPTPITTSTQTPTPTVSLTPACTEADKGRERESILKRFSDSWRRKIEAERQRIIAENASARGENAEASLGAIEYQVAFLKGCMAGSVTAKYVWKITSPTKAVSVPKEKRFSCVKIGDAWMCR
jgi:hypothetical protein